MRRKRAAAGLALPAGGHPDLDPAMVLERPKALYNARTHAFVLWFHVDTPDYELARVRLYNKDSNKRS